MTPRNPANILATIPTKAKLNASPVPKSINAPLASSYLASDARRKIAGNVKINPVDACVAPVVADVAMFTSEGDHLNAIPKI